MQEETPLLLTKKWLAVRFGLCSRNGRINYTALYSKVLTREVLETAGMTTAEVHSLHRSTFNRTQSAQLIQILHL